MDPIVSPATALKVAYRAINELKPNKRNARTHSPKHIRQIAESIKAFGFTNPILIDRDGFIVAGHGRVEAAKLLGAGRVPTICLEDLSAAADPRLCARGQPAGRACWLG